jgi:phage FluMu gp28-like protein
MPEGFASRPEHERTRMTADYCEGTIADLIATLEPNAVTYFGEDFGRTGDLTVIWPLQIRSNLLRRTPFVLELRNIPFRQQEQILFYIVDRLPRFTAGAMDARGNGQYLAETAMQRYGARIHQVMLSNEWYRENMPRYKAAFEDGAIELPRDADILADHRALVMDNGVVHVADRKNIGANGRPRHGDSAIAGALAYFASNRDTTEYSYMPAARAQKASSEQPGLWQGDNGMRPDRRGRFGLTAGAW